ncbi:MAG TPA: hypothetical protein VK190_03330 [Pseudoneobacillus sp.]|jgi:hypothetical protein|nr:hypothetical protein [Pseudoneobacillus sp.]
MAVKVLKKEKNSDKTMYKVEVFKKKFEFDLLENGNLDNIKDVTNGAQEEVAIGIAADLAYVFYNSEHIKINE